MNPTKPQYVHPFDWFRISHAQEEIKISPGVARQLAKEPDGPNLYKGIKPMPKATLGKYSEFDEYFSRHTVALPKRGKAK